MVEHKILFTGSVGAGKTTAIQAVSEIPVVCTDVFNSDASLDKATTTVGLDYGEISLGRDERLRLYGTPGQERFSFMWNVLAQGVLGVVILINHAQPEPLRNMGIYLNHFRSLIQETACVVVISKMNESRQPFLREFSEAMQKEGIVCPVIVADVRIREEVLGILDLLLVQIEARL